LSKTDLVAKYKAEFPCKRKLCVLVLKHKKKHFIFMKIRAFLIKIL